MPVEKILQSEIGHALRRASEASGVEFGRLADLARRESNFDPNAKALTSSAAGLFQFIDSTWLDIVKKHGAEHGLAREAAALKSGANTAEKRDILALRTDPEIAARMAAALTRDNAEVLQAKLGRAPSDGELCAAHVFGAGGALKLIAAAQDGAAEAAALFPREAAANKGLFYAKDGAALSAAGVLAKMTGDRMAFAAPAAPDTKEAQDAKLAAAAVLADFFDTLTRSLSGTPDRGETHSGLAAYLRMSR